MVTSLDTNVHPSRSINDMQINNCQHATGKDLPVCKSNNVSTMTMAYTHASLQHWPRWPPPNHMFFIHATAESPPFVAPFHPPVLLLADLAKQSARSERCSGHFTETIQLMHACFRIHWSTSEQASFMSPVVRLHCDWGNREYGDERQLVLAAAEACKWDWRAIIFDGASTDMNKPRHSESMFKMTDHCIFEV